MSTHFEWDPKKAASNLQKHGISFETALYAFSDPLARTERDRFDHGEERWLTIGMVDGHLLVLIAHTISEEDDDGISVEVIRIISARSADLKEKRRYAQ